VLHARVDNSVKMIASGDLFPGRDSIESRPPAVDGTRRQSTRPCAARRASRAIGTDSMGAIAPMAKQLWGAMPLSRPHMNFIMSPLYTAKSSVKLRMFHYESEKVS